MDYYIIDPTEEEARQREVMAREEKEKILAAVRFAQRAELLGYEPVEVDTSGLTDEEVSAARSEAAEDHLRKIEVEAIRAEIAGKSTADMEEQAVAVTAVLSDIGVIELKGGGIRGVIAE